LEISFPPVNADYCLFPDNWGKNGRIERTDRTKKNQPGYKVVEFTVFCFQEKILTFCFKKK